MSGLFSELRRRSVIKVALAYGVVAWLLMQVVSTIKEPLHLPEWFDTAVIVLLIIGFPIALVLAWAFDLTPQGLKRDSKDSPAAQSAEENDPPASAVLTKTNDEPRQSIAVLPFVDMSPDGNQEYFSDGIAEELLNQLTRLRDLHVAGRTSSFSFKGKNEDLRAIGQKLNVAHILEGSVRKSGNRVRVTAQLIKAADGYHLWSQSYDRELDDIFAIQEEIAHAVSDALSITLGVGNLGISTRNVEAYDAFLLGRAEYNTGGREGWSRAIEALRQATTLDPDFVEAQALLAWVALSASEVFLPDRAEELRPLGDQALGRAAAIAPETTAVLCVRGFQELGLAHWMESGRLCEMAFTQSPNDPLALQAWAQFLAEAGRVRMAVDILRRWTRVEPLYAQPTNFLALNLELAGELDQALEQYRNAARLLGDSNAYAGPILVVALTRGDRAAIESGLEKVLASNLKIPGHQELTQSMRDCLDDPEAALGELRRYHRNTEDPGSLMLSVVAIWASYFGDDALALEIFTSMKVGRTNTGTIPTMWRPIHGKMRRMPGFRELMRKRGVADYWRSTGQWGDYARPVGEDDFECF